MFIGGSVYGDAQEDAAAQVRDHGGKVGEWAPGVVSPGTECEK